MRQILAALVAMVSLGVAAPAMAEDQYEQIYDDDTYAPVPETYGHDDYAVEGDYLAADQDALHQQFHARLHRTDHQRLQLEREQLIRQGYGPRSRVYWQWEQRALLHVTRFHGPYATVAADFGYYPVRYWQRRYRTRPPIYSGGGGGYYRRPVIGRPAPVRQVPAYPVHRDPGLRVGFRFSL